MTEKEPFEQNSQDKQFVVDGERVLAKMKTMIVSISAALNGCPCEWCEQQRRNLVDSCRLLIQPVSQIEAAKNGGKR